MRTRVNKKGMGLAIALLFVAVVLFGIALATWSASPGPSCVRPGLSNTEIRECVAQRANAAEPNLATLTLLFMPGALLAASVAVGVRSLRRVMTIPEAAEELGFSPAEVRRLIDQGFLKIYDREQGAIYLDPEDVRRFSARRPTQDQPAHA